MPAENKDLGIRTALSLEPLLDFWEKQVAPSCDNMATMYSDFRTKIDRIPELKGIVKNRATLIEHRQAFAPLMSVVFPAASWETEIAGAVSPFTGEPFYYTPSFERLLLGPQGELAGKTPKGRDHSPEMLLLRAYHHILEQIYGLKLGSQAPIIKVFPDQESGLDRYFRMTPDLQFTQVRTVGPRPELTEEDLARIRENLTDLKVLAELIPLERFEHHGFAVVRAVEVTRSEVLSAIQKDLIDQENIFSVEGFNRVLKRLRVLFGRPHITAGLAAVLEEENKVLLVNSGCANVGCAEESCESVLTPTEVPLAASEKSIFKRVYETGRIEWISDLEEETTQPALEAAQSEGGIRSLMVIPLRYEDRIIGTMNLSSPIKGDLGPLDKTLAKQIAPLFSVSLKRGLDDRERRVQSIIKEKCTAVHPSVEWRFSQAARTLLDRQRAGQAGDLEPIVFKEVIPLFGQTDIRGSSEGRNRAIQADLSEQLGLALEVFRWAGRAQDWPLIQEMKHRLGSRLEAVAGSLASGDEKSVSKFLQLEIEPAFEDLAPLGPRVSEAVADYQSAVDPVFGMVYHRRKEFEDSVSLLNSRLSAYLDQEEEKAQGVFPHYFEKRQTDGLDYMIYVGSSMVEDGAYSPFRVKNLSLWQFLIGAGMARLTEGIKPELKVPLDTCQLILINQTPLSIRFRYDEKRFDVDGAYDVRHEIIKSRIDKALVKGGRERLTQPGRIAVVYSHQDEGWEARRHIDFLQARGELKKDLEVLELEDMPGVKGLKALRVGVDLEAEAVGERPEEALRA